MSFFCLWAAAAPCPATPPTPAPSSLLPSPWLVYSVAVFLTACKSSMTTAVNSDPGRSAGIETLSGVAHTLSFVSLWRVCASVYLLHKSVDESITLGFNLLNLYQVQIIANSIYSGFGWAVWRRLWRVSDESTGFYFVFSESLLTSRAADVRWFQSQINL